MVCDPIPNVYLGFHFHTSQICKMYMYNYLIVFSTSVTSVCALAIEMYMHIMFRNFIGSAGVHTNRLLWQYIYVGTL